MADTVFTSSAHVSSAHVKSIECDTSRGLALPALTPSLPAPPPAARARSACPPRKVGTTARTFEEEPVSVRPGAGWGGRGQRHIEEKGDGADRVAHPPAAPPSPAVLDGGGASAAEPGRGAPRLA